MARFLLSMTMALTISLAGLVPAARAEVTAKDVKHDTARAADSAATYAEQERDRYIRRAQKEVDELRLDIDRLGVKARAARDDVKARLDADIKALDKKWDATESKLDDVKAANARAWKKLKSGMDSAIEDLKQSLARARKEFD
jgi:peptidoglycan hydrolase CwlO-like protein